MPKILKIFFIPLFFLFLTSCEKNETAETGKIRIAVSISPYKYLVEKIGGEKVEVNLTIPRGANPHHYEPTPRVVKAIERSDYYFMVGGKFIFEEILFDKIVPDDGVMKRVDLSNRIEFIGNDPHIWNSAGNLKIISRNIFETLNGISPQDSSKFNANYKILIDSLDLAHRSLSSTIESNGIDYIVVNHSAWKYFARDFGLNEVAVQIGAKAASAKELEEYLKFIRTNNIPVIFMDPQRSIETISSIVENTGAEIKKLDPLALNPVRELFKINDYLKSFYGKR